MESLTYLGSGGLCIAAIACLSNQKTARLGNTLGLLGVGTGMGATLGAVSGTSGDPAVLAQIVGALGIGGAAGATLAKRMAITDLPQMVREGGRRREAVQQSREGGKEGSSQAEGEKG